ncbi:MAG TPA: tetratricopeptide repeat protein [Thermoanaerobaculia bacterium]|nr:tetratricopeptide repeat protein [Thermoanaerobaculia bacterium]
MYALVLATLLNADQIIDKYIEARGGLAALHSIRTIIYRGDYHEGDYQDHKAAMSLMRPYYKLVGDAEKPNPEFAEGYDGSAWEYYGDPGFVVRTTGAASAAGRHATTIDGPLVDYRERGWKVTLEGADKVGDRNAYRLRVHMRDGFEQDELIDAETFLLIAERKAAPVHAFGKAIASEERMSDYKPVEGGALFAFKHQEVEIATGRVLNEMTWTSITINHELPASAFSPPEVKRTAIGQLIEQLYAEREDGEAVMWTYADFRRAHPDVDTHDAAQIAGYQMLKMKDIPAATALLAANAHDYPNVPSAHFGLGRAYRTAGDNLKAKAEFRRALEIDPKYQRAIDALKEMR